LNYTLICTYVDQIDFNRLEIEVVVMLQRIIKYWDSQVGYKRSDPVKKLAKFLAGLTDTLFIRRVLSYSILKSEFKNLGDVEVFKHRKDIWDKALSQLDQKAITYIEFGVFKGESISYFSETNLHSDSTFTGLDSFEGLSEAWGGNEVGYFSTDGAVPESSDLRVKFVKGLFIDTWSSLYPFLLKSNNFIVHFDADLYSSTIFALSKMDLLQQEYLAVFDEFLPDEVRALSDYLVSYGAKVQFLAMQKWRGYPQVVLCRITPKVSITN
jgi:O-methyltransferase